MSDVFLSYSRRDGEVVRRLHAALAEAGREAWVDWQGIPPTAEWMAEVRAAVDAADAFLVVVSPDWAASPVCRQEVEHAAARGKRIVPVVVRDTEPASVPEQVAALNWIFLRDGDDFDAGLATLLAALDLDLEWVRAHTRLLTRAGEWEARGRERSLLLRGRDLQAAEVLVASAGTHLDPQPTALQAEYVYASRQAERRASRFRTLALSGGLVIAAVLAGFALVQMLRAEEQARVARDQAALAQSRELVAASRAQKEADTELGLLLAIEAAKRYPDVDTDEQLRRALEASQLRARFAGIGGPVTDLEVSDDGSRLLVNDGTVELWDPDAHAKVLDIPGAATAAALSRDGSTIAVALASDQGKVQVLDAHSGSVRRVIPAHDGKVVSIDLNEDGTRAVTAGEDRFARTWEVGTGLMLAVVAHASDQYSAPRVVRFSPDGSTVALTEGNNPRLRSSTDGSDKGLLIGHTNQLLDLTFSPDGSALATAGVDGARIWDLPTSSTVAVIGRFEEQVNTVAFDPAGARVISGGLDGTITIWDAISGASIRRIDPGVGEVTRVLFDSDGQTAFTASGSSSLLEWSADPLDVSSHLGAATAGANDLDVSPDGTRIVVAANDLAAHVYDSETGKEVQLLTGHSAGLYQSRFSADGSKVLTASPDGTARLWDASSGESLLTLTGPPAIAAAALSPDGAAIATGSDDGSIQTWTLDGHAAVSSAAGGATVTSLLYAAEGSRLLVGRIDGGLDVLDANALTQIRSLAGHQDAVFDLEMSPDGRTLLTASRDGRAKLWDIETGQMLRDIDAGAAGLYGARFSSDGRRIVTAGADPFARVWDVENGTLLAMLEVPGRLGAAAAFLPGSSDLVVVPHSIPAMVVRCELCTDPASVLALAERRITRELTQTEKETYLHAPTIAASESAPPVASSSEPPSDDFAPTPTPTPAPDEVCSFGAGACELSPGIWRASLLQPAIAIHVDHPITSYGQESSAALFVDPDNSQYLIGSGSQTMGAGKDEAIALDQNAAAVFDYLSGLSWLRVSEQRPITIGGLPGAYVRLDSERELATPIFYNQGVSWRWDPAAPMWVAVVDVGSTDLVIIAGSQDPEFDARFKDFLASIELTAQSPTGD